MGEGRTIPIVCGVLGAIAFLALLAWSSKRYLAEEEADLPSRRTSSTPSRAEEKWKSNALTALYGSVMIALSVGNVNFNNWLMEEDHFPYPVSLVFIHMAFCSAVTSLLLVVRPDCFPALTDPEQKVTVDNEYFWGSCVPIAIFFVMSLVLGNVAYSHLSLAFLQMIRTSNILWVYLASLLCGFETFGWGQMQILLLALCGVCMTIKGEMAFSMFGFLAQSAGILCECGRTITMSRVLSGGGKKLDPLSYMTLICPLSCVFLCFMLIMSRRLPSDGLQGAYAMPSIEKLYASAPVLLLSATSALALNFSIALFMKRTSAMASVMSNLVKDVAVVAIGVTVVKEHVSSLQTAGFAIQLLAVCLWALLKNYPDWLSGGLLQAIMASSKSCEEEDDKKETVKASSKAAWSGA